MADVRFPNGDLACPLCREHEQSRVHVYESPPEGEVCFPTASAAYYREIWRCATCGHFRSAHDMDLSALYSGEYVDTTYGGDGLRASFERVTSLPPERSDNVGRCARIDEFARALPLKAFADGEAPRLLDVGSGLGVFPHRMAVLGWSVTALDPDERAVRHIRDVAGVSAVEADFLEVDPSALGTHDVVTFNKVLEHVSDPAAMLAKAHEVLSPGGLVYVELPDGEAAARAGFGREEFFIDHHHVFSAASFSLLVFVAGFSLSVLERLREPSGKYTLRSFLARSEKP